MTVNIDVLFVGKQYERTRRAGIGGLTFYAAVLSGKTTTGYLVKHGHSHSISHCRRFLGCGVLFHIIILLKLIYHNAGKSR